MERFIFCVVCFPKLCAHKIILNPFFRILTTQPTSTCSNSKMEAPEISSKLTIVTPGEVIEEAIVNYEYILHIVLVFALLTLNK